MLGTYILNVKHIAQVKWNYGLGNTKRSTTAIVIKKKEKKDVYLNYLIKLYLMLTKILLKMFFFNLHLCKIYFIQNIIFQKLKIAML